MSSGRHELSSLLARREELSMTLQAAATEGFLPPDLVAEYEDVCAQIDKLDIERQLSSPSSPPSAQRITLDLGAIDSFVLPAGWEAGPTETLAGGRNIRMWRLTREPMARFVIYTRDHEFSSATSDAFQRVLYSEFHNLNRNELQSLGEVLEGMTNENAFDIHAAYTHYVNNRRAIRIDGIWIRDEMQTTVICIDIGGKGRKMQQVSYLAPKSFFEAYFGEATSIFQSIVWKNQANSQIR